MISMLVEVNSLHVLQQNGPDPYELSVYEQDVCSQLKKWKRL